MSADEELAASFVELADTLVDDFDLMEFLQTLTDRCVALLNVEAAVLLLAEHEDTMQVMAASSERARQLELRQLHENRGPSWDAFRSGTRISCPDLRVERQRWPGFADGALAAGFTFVHAVPMRSRGTMVGALNVFGTKTTPALDANIRVLQALADIATIGILHERAVRECHLLVEQLQTALNTRLILEQAKGVLAERRQISVDEAFNAMRRYARSHNIRLAVLARAIVERRPDIVDLTQPG